MVSAQDLTPGGRVFTSRSDHSAGAVSWKTQFNSSNMFVNCQLVCLPPAMHLETVKKIVCQPLVLFMSWEG